MPATSKQVRHQPHLSETRRRSEAPKLILSTRRNHLQVKERLGLQLHFISKPTE
jgi:hypothetical protein